MNITDTKTLLQEIAAVDKRKIEPETIMVWQGILANIPLEIALEAHKLARRDDRITYLEPKHIVSWAKEAAFKLDKENRTQEHQVERGDLEPTCKAHSKRILSCSVCCRTLYEQSHLHDAALLLWAREHIYA
jgi:hypothetical protein